MMKMIVDRAFSRGFGDHGWLKTYHTFSFGEYHNPERMGFGALRVLNDDTVAPGQGFGLHPHRNMEVVSIPLKGALRHGDSLENSRVIVPGQVQLMSAGSGIFHSEYNASQSEAVEFLQIWILPEKTNTSPHYEDYEMVPFLKRNEISVFVGKGLPMSIAPDVRFSWAEFDKGVERTYRLRGVRTGVYVFVLEGEVRVGDVELGRRDGAGVWGTEEFELKALDKSTLLLIEVPL